MPGKESTQDVLTPNKDEESHRLAPSHSTSVSPLESTSNDYTEVDELSSIRDALDMLLEEYLEVLQVYRDCQKHLSQRLKNAFLDLARSKTVLGPSKVGPRNYSLRQTTPNLYVQLEQTPAHETAENIIPSPNHLAEEAACNPPAEAYSFSFTVSPSGVLDASKTTTDLKSSGPRRRGLTKDAANDSANANVTREVGVNPAEKEEEEEEVVVVETAGEPEKQPPSDQSQPNADPILQFSALPPPVLRAAQAGFSRALASSLETLTARSRLGSLEKSIAKLAADLERRGAVSNVQAL